MKCLIQRVSQAAVTVDGTIVGQIGPGLLILVGLEKMDTQVDLDYCVKKLLDLRIFGDDQGKMNLSVQDMSGGLLIISQFTLAGNCHKGRRPSFDTAMPPDDAKRLFDQFLDQLRQSGLTVETGVFGAMMQVSLINDGPVTFMLESTKT